MPRKCCSDQNPSPIKMMNDELRQAFVETDYIVHHDPLFMMNIGKANPSDEKLGLPCRFKREST